MNKSLIAYYSWKGNTEVVAKEIQHQTGYDIIKIEEKKERKSKGIMAAAMGAFFCMKSRLKPVEYKLDKYDKIFLGAQVWAGKTTPAINSFLSKEDFKGKLVFLFITKADEKVPQIVIDSITKRIEKKGGKVIDSISFTVPFDPNKKYELSRENVEEPINQWLKTLENSDK